MTNEQQAAEKFVHDNMRNMRLASTRTFIRREDIAIGEYDVAVFGTNRRFKLNVGATVMLLTRVA